MTTTSSAVSPSAAATPAVDELTALRQEVARLRALLGPSEESYEKLRLDVLAARDVAFAAESELGRLRGSVVALTVDVARLRRDHLWFRHQVVRRLLATKHLLRKVTARLAH